MLLIWRLAYMVVSAVVLVALFGVVRGSFAQRAVVFPGETRRLALRMYVLQFFVPLLAIGVLWSVVVRPNPAYIFLMVAAGAYTLFFALAALGGLIGMAKLGSKDPHDEFRSIRQERMRGMTPEQQRLEAAEEERLRRDRP